MIKKENGREYQKKRVYKWENEMYSYKSQPILSENEIITLISSLTTKPFRLKLPKGTKRNLSATANSTIITLPIWARRASVIAHEVSHFVNHRTPESGHGPKFVSTLAEYYVAMGLSSRERAIASMIDFDLDFEWKPSPYQIEMIKGRIKQNLPKGTVLF